MIKFLKNIKSKGFIISNKLSLVTLLAFTLSCARYISYQEKIKSTKMQFGAVTCDESYTQKSDVYLGAEGNIDLFKEYKQKNKLNFFETVTALSRFQQYLRPDIITPSGRVQVFLGHNQKIYYAEAVSATNELNSPLFYLLSELKKKLNTNTTNNLSLSELLPGARVENGLARFLKDNKDLLAALANKDGALRNFYFKGENVLSKNESYPLHDLPLFIAKYSLDPKNYQSKIYEIDLKNVNSNYLCTNAAAKEPKDYFSLRQENSQLVRHHQFGVSFANGDFFLAIVGQSDPSTNFPKTPLLMSNNSPSVPWCFQTELNQENGQSSFTLVTSIGQKNPHQLLQSFLWNNTQTKLARFLDRLSSERFIFIQPPIRVLSEYVSEDDTLSQFEKLPFSHLGVSIQQIPIYHQDRVGEIIGITRWHNFQSFYFDGRNEDKYMTCPKNQIAAP